MNSKPLKRGVLMLIVIVIALLTAIRYQQVNANSKQSIRTVQIYHDQSINAHGVIFSISNVRVNRKGSDYLWTARMTIQQSVALPYGDRQPNRNFWENVRLVVPYRQLEIAQLQALDGSKLTYHQLTNQAPHIVGLKFSIPVEQFNNRDSRPYLLFMVPKGNDYTRYELYV